MKAMISYLNIAALILMSTISGCASGGNSIESSTTSDTEINSSTSQLEEDSTDTLIADTENISFTPVDSSVTTISGSIESSSLNRPDINTIIVNGDASERLDNYLRRVAGVRVQGEGPGASIRIRGVSTLNTGTSYNRDIFGIPVKPLGADPGWKSNANADKPLFIVDGIRVGRFFEDVYYRVNMSEVKDIRVLKGPEASMYGSDGSAGVIIITRFSASNPRGDE